MFRGLKSERDGEVMFTRSLDHERAEPNHLGGQRWTESGAIEVWHKPNLG